MTEESSYVVDASIVHLQLAQNLLLPSYLDPSLLTDLQVLITSLRVDHIVATQHPQLILSQEKVKLAASTEVLYHKLDPVIRADHAILRRETPRRLFFWLPSELDYHLSLTSDIVATIAVTGKDVLFQLTICFDSLGRAAFVRRTLPTVHA